MAKPPVIFLAFANDFRVESQYLRKLKEEETSLKDVLRQAEDAGLCEVVSQYGATFDDIKRVFTDAKYAGRIVVFHYGGHSNRDNLFLQASDGSNDRVSIEFLAQYLGLQKGLKLVFLNGCNNGQYAGLLLHNKVPIAVCTSAVLKDADALFFAKTFYEHLRSGSYTVVEAYRSAQLIFQNQHISPQELEQYRDLVEEVHQKKDFPWEILGGDSPVALEWTLKLGLPLSETTTTLPLAGFPKDFYLHIDRRLQYDQFESFYLRDADRPRICLLPGDEQSRHVSLVRRFIKYLRDKLIHVNDYWYLDTGRNEVPMPWPSQAEERLALIRTFETFNVDTNAPGFQAQDARPIVEKISPDTTVVSLVQIKMEEWKKENVEMLKWYINDFWNVPVREGPGDRRQLYLFLNVYTRSGFERKKRLFGLIGRDAVNDFFDEIEKEAADSQKPPRVVLPVLGDIPVNEISEGIDLSLRQKFQLSFNNFADAFRGKQAWKMAEVEDNIDMVLRQLKLKK
jgi:hypothetical protein